jgi:hypothetical protein
MLEQFQDAGAIACRQYDSFVPGHHFFGGRQGSPHHEGGEIQPFVRGGSGQHALFLARCSQFDAVITCSR